MGKTVWVGSKDPNYYRDLALTWPFILFLVSGLAKFGTERRLGALLLALATACLLLAKDRLLMVLAVLGLGVLQGWVAVVVKGSKPILLVTIGLTLAFVVVAWFSRNRQLRYVVPTQIGILDLIIVVATLYGSLLLVMKLT